MTGQQAAGKLGFGFRRPDDIIRDLGTPGEKSRFPGAHLRGSEGFNMERFNQEHSVAVVNLYVNNELKSSTTQPFDNRPSPFAKTAPGGHGP